MLTDVAIKALKSKDKPYKIADRDGMYVHETPDPGRARSLAHHPGENVDQSRLARAIGAQQAEDAALRHIESHPVQRQLARTLAGRGITLDEIVDRDRGGQSHGMRICARIAAA